MRMAVFALILCGFVANDGRAQTLVPEPRVAPAATPPPVAQSPPDELSTIRVYGYTVKLRSRTNGDCNGYVFFLNGDVSPNRLRITDILEDPTAAWELMNKAPGVSVDIATECLEPEVGQKIFRNGPRLVRLNFFRAPFEKSEDCIDKVQGHSECVLFRRTTETGVVDKYGFIAYDHPPSSSFYINPKDEDRSAVGFQMYFECDNTKYICSNGSPNRGYYVYNNLSFYFTPGINYQASWVQMNRDLSRLVRAAVSKGQN